MARGSDRRQALLRQRLGDGGPGGQGLEAPVVAAPAQHLITAIFAFLLAWNDHLVATVFLRSTKIFTLPMGMQSFFQQNQTDWTSVVAVARAVAVAVAVMLPPILVLAGR